MNQEYAVNTASSLMKVKSKFHDSKVDSAKEYPDKWIYNFEYFKIHVKIWTTR